MMRMIRAAIIPNVIALLAIILIVKNSVKISAFRETEIIWVLTFDAFLSTLLDSLLSMSLHYPANLLKESELKFDIG